MADDRSIGSEVEKLGELERRLAALDSMVTARMSRRPTGTLDSGLVAMPNTLVLNGQTVSRTEYAGLWQWAQDNALVKANLFTVGDGSTTFGLPNFAGRVMVAAGTLGTDTYAVGAMFGAARVTLAATEMPGHTHTGTISASSHSHGSTGASGGNHGGHFPTTSFMAASGSDLGLAAWNGGTGNEAHTHGTAATEHTHTFTPGSAGGGQAHENRPPSVAVLPLIWV